MAKQLLKDLNEIQSLQNFNWQSQEFTNPKGEICKLPENFHNFSQEEKDTFAIKCGYPSFEILYWDILY